MKTLTIKQPWASLIAHGVKDIENRTWKTKYRGKILIHAAAKPVPFNGLINGVDFTMMQKKQIFRKWPISIHGRYPDFMSKWLNSAIIGEVEIIDCVVNHKSFWAEPTTVLQEKPIYNWVLKNPILYDKPIENVKGKLSFWNFESVKNKNLEQLFKEHAEFSDKAFGKNRGPLGPLNHLKQEVLEVIAEPKNHSEYADCLLLLVDAFRSIGGDHQALINAAFDKLEINKNRTWSKPDVNGVYNHES